MRERTVSLLFLVATLLVTSFQVGAQEIRARGEITVERVIIDAHVTDAAGNPILGLEPKDFRVRVDGKLAEVESVDWIGAGSELGALGSELESNSPEPRAPSSEPAPRGRLLIFFFQNDFARERVIGHMRMIAYATEMLDTLLPGDRVAVMQFDSHLKLRIDFTSDKEKLAEAIRESLLIDIPPPVEEGEPSLAEH
ncbi:MAG TPA: hypothetical protein VIL97_00350, partial [Thermoanaerobaculia bacterium]